MPEVSVIIPCYNHGRYLDEAVDSVLNQTYQDVEILVVNDGSTDRGTIEKLQGYQKPKTRVIHIENQGPGGARNIGIAEAQGDYILLLDADDAFEKTFLQKALNSLARHPEVGIVTCGIQRFGANSRRSMPSPGGLKECVLEHYPCGNALFRKVCWQQCGGYCENMRQGYEDWDFWIRVTAHGWRFDVVPEYLFFYRQHERSRRMTTHDIRPQLIKLLVENHREHFQRYIDDVLWEKEQKILKLKYEKAALLHSKAYRIGTAFLRPLKALRQFGWAVSKKMHGK